MRGTWFSTCLAVLACILSPSSPLLAHDLPVGDGKVTDHPEAGNVYACAQIFRQGGARHVGDWFHGETWDPLAKPHVLGKVIWPNARFSVTAEGDRLSVTGNGLPVGEPTGTFPISRRDPAYAYDTNPNAILAIPLDFAIPSQPGQGKDAGLSSDGHDRLHPHRRGLLQRPG